MRGVLAIDRVFATVREPVMTKVLVWVAFAFAVYFVVTAPDAAADAVRSVGHGGQHAVESVRQFVQDLAP